MRNPDWRARALLVLLSWAPAQVAKADLIGIPEVRGQDGYIALRDVSADGQVAVGDEYFDGGGTPFRWTRAQGIQFISVCCDQAATALSADGGVAVGGGSTDAWYATGTQAVLLPPLTGVQFEGGAAQDVTPDGSVIVGWSYPGSSSSEPGTALLAGVGLGALAARRRRRRSLTG